MASQIVNGSAESLDLYEILSIDSTATKVDIKKAYHKAALSSHPDKVPEGEREEAAHRFKDISRAYEILYDDDKRAHYDRFGMSDFTSGGAEVPGDDDLEELLSRMFGMGGVGMDSFPGMGGMPRGPGEKQKGKNVVQQYEVSLEELYKGKTVKLASTRNVLCTTCKGSGGRDKAKPKKCATCAGRGWNQNLRQVGRGLVTKETVACVSCKGNGTVFRGKDRCKKCKGNCVNEEKKVLEIYIPRGSKEGERIVLSGEADELPGHETGDIIFVLEEKLHDVFCRAGADLTAPLNVSLAECLTGFSRVVIKHLDGRGIQIAHPQGSVLRPGQVLKIAGEGMPHKKGDGKGDLYLVVDIEFPEDGWNPDVESIRKVLPTWRGEEVKAEQVDLVLFDPDGDMDDYGESEEGSGGGVWVDDDDDDDGDDDDGRPQCAQQ